MTRTKHSSPTLQLTISDADRQEAIQSSSGGCLIADAIQRQYPHLSGIVVDMATIRVTDAKKGERYTYLTTSAAEYLILSFDQGWMTDLSERGSLVIKRAVQITPVITSKARQTRNEARRVELETLEATKAPMSRQQKAALTMIRQRASRPTTRGPADVKVTEGGSSHGAVIRGGEPRVQGPSHPNLLRGRNRHFGAKLADPGQAFQEAVEQAVRAQSQQQSV